MKHLRNRNRSFVFRAWILVAGLALLQSCHSGDADVRQAGEIYYTCSMHPDIHADRPGKCPVCGMTLEKVVSRSRQDIPDSALNDLTQPVNEVVAGSFKVIMPVKVSLRDTVEAYGHIGFDRRDMNMVSSRVAGRVEKLYVTYTNQRVRKGQPLMDIYSPQLLSAQRDLLQALGDRDTSLIAVLKKRLLNLGMDKAAIQKVLRNGKMVFYITVYSPYNGFSVDLQDKDSKALNTEKSMEEMDEQQMKNRWYPGAVTPLSIREGAYVNAGEAVFAIQGIERTWAVLGLFSADLWKIHTGDRVLLSADADPSRIIEGSINFISPYRDENKKTTSVRIYLPADWKPGTVIRGRIISSHKKAGWLLPATAVVRLGTYNVVWVQDKRNPGIYKKRNVNVGEEINDRIHVISGIDATDRIVANASYMVDSDTFY